MKLNQKGAVKVSSKGILGVVLFIVAIMAGYYIVTGKHIAPSEQPVIEEGK